MAAHHGPHSHNITLKTLCLAALLHYRTVCSALRLASSLFVSLPLSIRSMGEKSRRIIVPSKTSRRVSVSSQCSQTSPHLWLYTVGVNVLSPWGSSESGASGNRRTRKLTWRNATFKNANNLKKQVQAIHVYSEVRIPKSLNQENHVRKNS